MRAAVVCLLFLAWSIAVNAASTATPNFPTESEWPCFRRDGGLLARSPAMGRIVQPQIKWKYYVGRLQTTVIAEPDSNDQRLQLPRREERLTDSKFGRLAKGFQVQAHAGAGEEQDYDPITTTFADVLPDDPGPEKIVFESGFGKPSVKGQWQQCVGRCYARRAGQWVQVWQTAPIDLLFQPMPMVGDFDGDGRLEIAVLPFHELLLFEARTGEIKDRCRFTETRSYGFFGVYDFDHDGRKEFLVMSDFSKHIDVLGFRAGKLFLLWQQNIELDISNPQKVLRVPPQPVADIDGDGHDEVLASIYNGAGDDRWHLVAYDALTGAVRTDLVDQQLVGLLDLDRDGVTELLTTESVGATTPQFGTIAIWSLRSGTPKRLWSMAQSAWQTQDEVLPGNIKSSATLGKRTVLSQTVGNETLVVIGQEQEGGLVLKEFGWKGGKFVERFSVSGRQIEATGIDRAGRLLVQCQHVPGVSETVIAKGGRLIRGETQRLGINPGPVTVTWPVEAERAVLAVQGTGEELVLFESSQTNGEGHEVRRIQGRGQSVQWPEARGPVMADLLGNGRRQLLYATASPTGAACLVAMDWRGTECWRHDFPEIPGGAPVWNIGGLILWQAGHFTDPRRQDLLVTVRRSMMHSEETCLLSGSDGHELWRRVRQVSQRGVGGTPFAIADFDGDGLDDACSFHPSVFYILQGKTGRDLLARDATWDAVPAKPVYWGLPAAVSLRPGAAAKLFFGGRSMTALVDPDGSLAWYDALDHAAPSWPAFGVFGPGQQMEAIGFGYEDGARCYDLNSGKVKWRTDQLPPGSVSGTASADLDGDGRDEAIVVIGRKLVCLGGSNGQGIVKWTVDLPTDCGPPSLAPLEKGGPVSILVAGGDGVVYCIQ